MSKKKKPIRAKLIANPGAGNVLEAASRLEQVTQCLLENGLKVDVALAHPKRNCLSLFHRFPANQNGVGLSVSLSPRPIITHDQVDLGRCYSACRWG